MTRSSKKQSFLIYRNWLTTWLCLPNDVYIDITKGVFAYFLDEEYTFQTDVGKALFEGYRDILEGNKMHYVEIIKKRSEAGKKSAESRKADVNTCQQVLTDVAEKDKEKESSLTTSLAFSSASEDKPVTQHRRKNNGLKSKREAWFAEFWTEYPKKTGKGQAEKAFTKACRSEVDFAAIMHGLSDQNRLRFIPMKQNGESRFIPMPATWLNGKRWEDEIEPYQSRQAMKDKQDEESPF